MDLLPYSGIAEFGQSLRGPSRLLDKSLLVKLKCQKTSQSAPGPWQWSPFTFQLWSSEALPSSGTEHVWHV